MENKESAFSAIKKNKKIKKRVSNGFINEKRRKERLVRFFLANSSCENYVCTLLDESVSSTLLPKRFIENFIAEDAHPSPFFTEWGNGSERARSVRRTKLRIDSEQKLV